MEEPTIKLTPKELAEIEEKVIERHVNKSLSTFDWILIWVIAILTVIGGVTVIAMAAWLIAF